MQIAREWQTGQYLTALDNGLSLVRARADHQRAYAIHLTRADTTRIIAQAITDRGRAMDTFRKAAILVEAGRL